MKFYSKFRSFHSRKKIFKYVVCKMRVILFSLQCVEMADIVKNFGALQHRRTGKHMENPLCIGPPKSFTVPNFFSIEISHTGAPYGNFFVRQTATVSVFISHGPKTSGFSDVWGWQQGSTIFGWSFCQISLIKLHHENIGHIFVALVFEFPPNFVLHLCHHILDGCISGTSVFYWRHCITVLRQNT